LTRFSSSFASTGVEAERIETPSFRGRADAARRSPSEEPGEKILSEDLIVPRTQLHVAATSRGQSMNVYRRSALFGNCTSVNRLELYFQIALKQRRIRRRR
jgi:hypothetical protein